MSICGTRSLDEIVMKVEIRFDSGNSGVCLKMPQSATARDVTCSEDGLRHVEVLVPRSERVEEVVILPLECLSVARRDVAGGLSQSRGDAVKSKAKEVSRSVGMNLPGASKNSRGLSPSLKQGVKTSAAEVSKRVKFRKQKKVFQNSPPSVSNHKTSHGKSFGGRIKSLVACLRKSGPPRIRPYPLDTSESADDVQLNPPKEYLFPLVTADLLQLQSELDLVTSAGKECSICFEEVVEKTPEHRIFGVLSNCNHCYCLACIKTWREMSGKPRCPKCDKAFYFICPSPYWPETDDAKLTLISKYILHLSSPQYTPDCLFCRLDRLSVS